MWANDINRKKTNDIFFFVLNLLFGSGAMSTRLIQKFVTRLYILELVVTKYRV